MDVSLPSGGISHAVLFDKEKTDSQNDSFYYFKDSYGPNNPHIKIPKNRATYQHFKLLEMANTGQLQRYLQPPTGPPFQYLPASGIGQIMQMISPGMDLTISSSPCWAVAELYLLSIADK